MPDFAFAATENLAVLGTPAVKYAQNLAALRVLHDLAATGRTEATRHEQEMLVTKIK